MATHNITQSWSRNGEAVSVTVEMSGSGEVNLDETIAASQTNKLVTFVCDVSAMTSLFISCDETITIKTNDSATPDDTITVTADKPIVWYTACGHDNPFSVDVTELYITTTNESALKIRLLQDATP